MLPEEVRTWLIQPDFTHITHKHVNYNNRSTKPFLQVSSSQLTEVSRALEEVSGDLREMEKTMSLIRNSSSSTKEERRPGYWTRMTKRINKVFFICYFTAAILFLMCMFSLWIIAEDN